MLFLCHSSVDVDKTILFPNFHPFLKLCLWVMHISLYCTVACYVDIINQQMGRLFASPDVKISTVLEKNGGWGCGSRIGPLIWS